MGSPSSGSVRAVADAMVAAALGMEAGALGTEVAVLIAAAQEALGRVVGAGVEALGHRKVVGCRGTVAGLILRGSRRMGNSQLVAGVEGNAGL